MLGTSTAGGWPSGWRRCASASRRPGSSWPIPTGSARAAPSSTCPTRTSAAGWPPCGWSSTPGRSGSSRPVRSEGLRLAVDRVHYFSHWITPEPAPKRYDTRFFVTALPPGQVPIHDDHETTATVWVRPTEALARARAGEFDIIFPTIKNLEAIGRFTTSAELLAAAAAVERVPTVLPRVVADERGFRILLPGRPRLRRGRRGRRPGPGGARAPSELGDIVRTIGADGRAEPGADWRADRFPLEPGPARARSPGGPVGARGPGHGPQPGDDDRPGDQQLSGGDATSWRRWSTPGPTGRRRSILRRRHLAGGRGGAGSGGSSSPTPTPTTPRGPPAWPPAPGPR